MGEPEDISFICMDITCRGTCRDPECRNGRRDVPVAETGYKLYVPIGWDSWGNMKMMKVTVDEECYFHWLELAEKEKKIEYYGE